jgi:phosphatidylglycerophosphatase A
VKLWLAQGLGVGRIPVAPGTFGSVVGLLWFGLLLVAGQLWLFLAGTVALIGLSVWLCGEAEKTLKQKDPGSVVLDEIAALPVCFVAWVLLEFWKSGALPPFGWFFSPHVWPTTLGVFVAFRFFDVAKPWPVHQSQSLPGGWGVTLDDVLAAVYVNVVVLVVYGVRAGL